MGDSNEFGKNINELLRVLKKVLHSQKMGGQDLSSLLDKKNVNLNLCFFSFLPISEDELVDFEGEMQDYMDEDAFDVEDMKFEINSNDQEFLQQNGIRF